MDAIVPQGVRRIAYGQAVWSCPANAGDKPARKLAGDGGKKLVRRGDHGAAVKPLRRECRVISAYLCWPRVRLFCLHARQWVRRAPGIPCALCFSEGHRIARLGREIAPRECCCLSSPLS
jgi:hypothetical protein